jgi:hypothetical protein
MSDATVQVVRTVTADRSAVPVRWLRLVGERWPFPRHFDRLSM